MKGTKVTGVIDPNDGLFKPYKGVKEGQIVDYYGMSLKVVKRVVNNKNK